MRKRRNKYGAIKTEVDGRVFDSKLEASRYIDLLKMQENGSIHNLRCQVTYKFALNSIKICSYKADFVYDLQDGSTIVEDVKSFRTARLPAYRIKNKMMKAFYGIDIKEVF